MFSLVAMLIQTVPYHPINVLTECFLITSTSQLTAISATVIVLHRILIAVILVVPNLLFLTHYFTIYDVKYGIPAVHFEYLTGQPFKLAV